MKKEFQDLKARNFKRKEKEVEDAARVKAKDEPVLIDRPNFGGAANADNAGAAGQLNGRDQGPNHPGSGAKPIEGETVKHEQAMLGPHISSNKREKRKEASYFYT